jgi:hypothetical protein
VLVVVGASYALAHRVVGDAYVAAPVVRTAGAPGLSFAPVDRTRRATYKPASSAPATPRRPGLYALPKSAGASSSAASGSVGDAVNFSADPWAVQTPASLASAESARSSYGDAAVNLRADDDAGGAHASAAAGRDHGRAPARDVVQRGHDRVAHE